MRGEDIIPDRLLGTGTMGDVFLARATGTTLPPLAVKILKTDQTQLLNHFEEEVRILSRLKHPHLVAIHGFSRTPKPSYWMDYVEGVDLLEAAQRAEPERIIEWFHECLDALEYLHSQGVVHGDLKPANVLVDREGRIKLVDFGLATFRGSDPKAGASSPRGTLPYLSPEALEGKPIPASDLFALGTVFYQAFSGEHPRAGAKNLAGLFAPPHRPLQQATPGLPQRLTRVIDRMIAADLTSRFKNVEDIRSSLQKDLSTKDELLRPDSFHTFLMFGREKEWQKVRDFMQDGRRDHHTGLILVHGPSGIGKTRFAQEVFFQFSLEGIPCQLISSLKEAGPEDLYHRLKSRTEPMMILEYGDEEAIGERKALLGGIGDDRHVLDLPLSALSREDSERFIAGVLHTPISPDLLQEAWDLTQGNPKHLTLVCQEIKDSGLKRLTLPPTLEDIFAKRMQSLPEIGRRLLSWIAMAGLPATSQDLAELSGHPLTETRSALSALLTSQWIKSAGPDEFIVTHAFLPEIIQRTEKLSAQEMEKRHQRWLERIEAVPSLRESHEGAIAAAQHALAIEDCSQTLSWVLKAGEVYQMRREERSIIRLFERSLVQCHSREARDSLLRGLANAHGRLGSFSESIAFAEQWFLECPEDEIGINPLKYWLSTGISYKNLGQREEARTRLENAVKAGIEEQPQHRGFLARAHSLLGLLDVEEDPPRLEDAGRHFERSMQLLPANSEQRAEVFKHQALKSEAEGAWEAAQKHFSEAEKIYRSLDYARGIFSVMLERGNLALRMNRVDEAASGYSEALSLAIERKEEALAARAYQNIGVLACRKGDFATALEELEQARKILSFFGSASERALNLIQLGLAQASVGNFSLSDELLQKAVDQAENLSEISSRLEEVRLFCRLLKRGWKAGDTPPQGWNLRSGVPSWDYEKKWLSLLSSATAEGQEELKQLLETLHERLPDSLKIGFEERYDFRRFVLKQKDLMEEQPFKEEKSMDVLQKLYAITRDLLSSDDVEGILARIMDSAIELSSAERGFLLVRSPAKTDGPVPGYELKISRNISRELVEKEDSTLSLSAVREAMKTGEAVVTDNALQDSRFENAPSVHNLELKAILALPLKGTTGVIGALYLDHRYQALIFRGDDLHILQMFADQAALALQKTQMIQQLQASNQKLEKTVEVQTSEITALKREVENQREQLSHEYQEVVGQSPPMMEVLSLVDRLIDTSVPVWIYGESGTGKEMIARALHFKSARHKKPFVSENCSTLPETLLESELFGHKKGSFTHADRDKKGLLVHADGGTVFLDEIADMSPAMQSKMLRFLQEGEIRPIGSNEIIKVDVRVVSASNRDLQELIHEGKFREDLFYRLNGVTVNLPPLRERLEDIPLLAQHFLKKQASGEKRETYELTPDAIEMLMDYSWPGNVRELENALRTASLFHHKGKIPPKAFSFKKTLVPGGGAEASTPRLKPVEGKPKSGGAHLTEEKRLLLKALFDTGYHKGLAAEKLGISRRYLYTQMLRYGVPVSRVEMKSYVEKQLGI